MFRVCSHCQAKSTDGAVSLSAAGRPSLNLALPAPLGPGLGRPSQETSMPLDTAGFVQDKYAAAKAAFEANFESAADLGALFCARRRDGGRPVGWLGRRCAKTPPVSRACATVRRPVLERAPLPFRKIRTRRRRPAFSATPCREHR